MTQAADATDAAGVGDAADTEAVRRLWPQVMTRVGQLRRGTWTLVSDNAQVLDYEDSTLRLGFSTEGLAKTFSTGAHAGYLRQALVDVLGLDARVVATFAGSEAAPSSPRSEQQAGQRQSNEQRGGQERGSQGHDTEQQQQHSSATPGNPPTTAAGVPTPTRQRPQTPGWETPAPAPAHGAAVQAGGSAAPDPAHAAPASRDDGPPAASDPPPADPPPDPEDAPPPPDEPSRRRSAPPAASSHVSPEDDVPGRDDPDAEDSGLVGAQVVEQLLGGRVIDEDGPRR